MSAICNHFLGDPNIVFSIHTSSFPTALSVNMPGRKRKASSNSATPSKKVRIGNTTDIPDQPSSLPRGRPKRASVGNPNYSIVTRRSSSGTQNATTATTESEPAVKRRGRPPKSVTSTPTTSKAEEAPKKGRGRPPKKGTSELHIATLKMSLPNSLQRHFQNPIPPPPRLPEHSRARRPQPKHPLAVLSNAADNRSPHLKSSPILKAILIRWSAMKSQPMLMTASRKRR